MDTAALALLSMLIGVVLGGAVALVVIAAYRERDRAAAAGSAQIPEAAREIVHALPDAAAVVDPSGTVLVASAPSRALGLREGKALQVPALALLARAARVGTAPPEVTLALADASGSQRTLSAHPRMVTSRLVLLVLRDVTEQERTERMRRDFVQNTSHELKTPAAAVSLLAEALDAAADDPEQVRAFARRLHKEGKRLGSLTARIMTLSRVQSETALELAPVDVDAAVEAAVAAHREAALAADVAVVVSTSGPAWVVGDAELLQDAVGNLIANAIAYSPPGAHVGVGVKCVEGVVEVAVADQGTGIAEADQQRVFERFYRADAARSRRTGGTGLGLSIVKHVVGRHGGEVRLWSKPGRGSTFTIRLPETAAPAAPRKGRAA